MAIRGPKKIYFPKGATGFNVSGGKVTWLKTAKKKAKKKGKKK